MRDSRQIPPAPVREASEVNEGPVVNVDSYRVGPGISDTPAIVPARRLRRKTIEQVEWEEMLTDYGSDGGA